MSESQASWLPERPHIRPLRLAVSWLVSAVALLVAALVVPHVSVEGIAGAIAAAALIAIFNALLPPLVASLRLPFTLLAGFVLVLVLDAAMLRTASIVRPSAIHVDSLWWALLASLLSAAVTIVVDLVVGVNDEDTYTLRVVGRIARRSGEQVRSDIPGLVFLEIDGLALPVLRRAMRDGNAPTLATWVASGSHRLVEWETDFSSQTGASQAGILLGSNDGIPAFRWIEKETGRMMSCSAPAHCAEIERRLANGNGLLTNGGASRGNLLSGEAEHVILTVSRMEAERGPNPGYRAFLANGFNVTRVLVLFGWEVVLELVASLRARRRDVRPRGHRGGIYPLLRATMCVLVRDLIVFGVISDMLKGRPAVYATFSSYDEVAHHSGVERADTLEALRKLDQQFARIERARRFAARPYELVVLSDHGQTQGATFLQRNGYTLAELVERSLSHGTVTAFSGGDEQSKMASNALDEATGRTKKRPKDDVSGRQVVVLGSGNLGLVYLMEEPRRLTLEEIDERHPDLLRSLCEHPHVGFLLVRSASHGPVVLGPRGAHHLLDGRVVGDDPLAPFSPNAPRHLLRTDGFDHVADVMVNSFYDPQLDEGCAFEELISFHGGMGGPQTRAFVLHPAALRVPDEPLVGAAAVHDLLSGWRRSLQRAPDDRVGAAA
jgi:uncharacterized membrane protein YvlD (DUF360 family)